MFHPIADHRADYIVHGHQSKIGVNITTERIDGYLGGCSSTDPALRHKTRASCRESKWKPRRVFSEEFRLLLGCRSRSVLPEGPITHQRLAIRWKGQGYMHWYAARVISLSISAIRYEVEYRDRLGPLNCSFLITPPIWRTLRTSPWSWADCKSLCHFENRAQFHLALTFDDSFIAHPCLTRRGYFIQGRLCA